jgi:hypothetical protein
VKADEQVGQRDGDEQNDGGAGPEERCKFSLFDRVNERLETLAGGINHTEEGD